MNDLIFKALTAYALTFVITSSSILEPIRNRVVNLFPWMKFGNHPHFIQCRMCVGFWVSAVVACGDWGLVMPIYGLSYFLATQER